MGGLKKTSHGSPVELINGRKRETEQGEQKKKKEKGIEIRRCCARGCKAFVSLYGRFCVSLFF